MSTGSIALGRIEDWMKTRRVAHLVSIVLTSGLTQSRYQKYQKHLSRDLPAAELVTIEHVQTMQPSMRARYFFQCWASPCGGMGTMASVP